MTGPKDFTRPGAPHEGAWRDGRPTRVHPRWRVSGGSGHYLLVIAAMLSVMSRGGRSRLTVAGVAALLASTGIGLVTNLVSSDLELKGWQQPAGWSVLGGLILLSAVLVVLEVRRTTENSPGALGPGGTDAGRGGRGQAAAGGTGGPAVDARGHAAVIE
jgi:hypothetical protein